MGTKGLKTLKDKRDAAHENDKRLFSQPFKRSVAIDKPELRTAHALEYIAAQLGMIREHLEKSDSA